MIFGRSTSLRKLIITHMLMMIVFTVAGLGVLLLWHVDNLQTERDADNQNRVEVFSGHLSQLVTVYTDIVNSIARRSDTADMLQFPDRDKADSWANSMRAYLPGSISLALVDTDGEVLGDPQSLRVGDRCIMDIEGLSQGEHIGTPAIHDDVEGLEHFDIIVPVDSPEGLLVGRVFVSYSLDVIESMISRHLKEQETVEIIMGDHGAFASFGSGVGNRLYSAPVEGTSWTISLRVPSAGLSVDRQGIAIVAAACLVLLAAIMWVLVRSLGKVTSRELTHINDMLDSLYDTNSRARIMREVKLKESEALVEHINRIADRLIDREARLEDYGKTDQLTGMYNRYVADDAYSRLLTAVKKGVKSALVMIDLDHFRECNDRCGHAHGDRVLKLFARCLTEAGQGSDDSLRFGGTEFITMFYDTDRSELEAWYQRLSQSFVDMQQTHIKDVPSHVTCAVSASAVLIDHADLALEEVLERAESLLVEIRESGRSGIRCIEASSTGTDDPRRKVG